MFTIGLAHLSIFSIFSLSFSSAAIHGVNLVHFIEPYYQIELQTRYYLYDFFYFFYFFFKSKFELIYQILPAVSAAGKINLGGELETADLQLWDSSLLEKLRHSKDRIDLRFALVWFSLRPLRNQESNTVLAEGKINEKSRS